METALITNVKVKIYTKHGKLYSEMNETIFKQDGIESIAKRLSNDTAMPYQKLLRKGCYLLISCDDPDLDDQELLVHEDIF